MNCELIKTDKITIDKDSVFEVKRDIFDLQRKSVLQDNERKIAESKKEPDVEIKDTEEKETKVIATVFYEGFLLKGDEVYALLKVNSQFFISKEGDKLPDDIVIRRIMKKSVLLEIESNEITILKKGEGDVD